MRWLLALAVAAATLGTIDSAAAAGRRGEHNGSRSGDHRDRSSDHRRSDRLKFTGGYYYPGRYNHEWSRHYYWAKYHCNCYYSPESAGWYYWCAGDNCYYPTSYINTKPPVAEPDDDEDDD